MLLLLLFLWFVLLQYSERTYLEYGNRMAAMAEAFFTTFMTVQFVLAVFLTPAYVASAITEEKERKTLEFLLATDLASREIVLGKLASRLGNLGLLLLAGLPVLSAVQFLGGVQPELLLAGFAATALTVAGLAGISVLASVYTRRSRDAIMLTYLTAITYFAACGIALFLQTTGYFSTTPLLPGGPSAADCLHALLIGNPFYALGLVFERDTQSLSFLPSYAVFYVVLTAATLGLAMLRLRPVCAARGQRGQKDARGSKPIGATDRRQTDGVEGTALRHRAAYGTVATWCWSGCS